MEDLEKRLEELKIWHMKNRYLAEKPKEIVGRFKEVRKEIARILTILNERKLIKK